MKLTLHQHNAVSNDITPSIKCRKYCHVYYWWYKKISNACSNHLSLFIPVKICTLSPRSINFPKI